MMFDMTFDTESNETKQKNVLYNGNFVSLFSKNIPILLNATIRMF